MHLIYDTPKQIDILIIEMRVFFVLMHVTVQIFNLISV